MHPILTHLTSPILLTVTLAGCSCQGGKSWRRVCDSILDDAERTRCLDDATRSRAGYRRDVDKTLEQ